MSLAPCFYKYLAPGPRLRAERALATPGAPATTPSPATPHPGHHLHPEAILDSLSHLHGGDEGIASASLPSTPAPTPFSPSPSVAQQVTSDQIAASIQKLREEGVGSMTSTQPTTPSSTPAYPPNIGLPLAGGPNLGVIPEHLAEGMNNIFRVGAGGSPSRGGADSGGMYVLRFDFLVACGNIEMNNVGDIQEQTVEVHLAHQHQLRSLHHQLK